MNRPTSADDLVSEQHRLAAAAPGRWSPPALLRIGAVHPGWRTLVDMGLVR